MLSAIFCALFGISLLPGRTPLCMHFARKVSGGIVPDGAEEYCRRLTWVWFFVLLGTTSLALADWRLSLASPAAIALTFIAEGRIRRRRFSKSFNTSGSTGGSKTIVKSFESLAKEVAFHRDFYMAEFGDMHDVVFLATIESRHMYGTLWREMLPKALGCRMDSDVIMTPEALIAKMKAAKRVFLATTPSFLERITAYAAQYEMPRNCIEITTSGAMLPWETAKRTREMFGVTPREIFGSTETGGVAWRRQASGGEPWQVFGPVKVHLEDGRIAVRSPFSFKRKHVMGDGAEMARDRRSFKLLGRMDRLVKINEQRVDLAEMEGVVRSLGFRECALAALDGERGLHLGALVVAGDGRARTPLELRRLFLPVFPKGTVPKRIRLVQALPRNAQGKVVAEEVKAILQSSLAEPFVENAALSGGTFSGEISFDGTEQCFSGHFPGFPILPGVAQLGLAVRWSALLTGDASRRLKMAKKMKFSKAVRPGDRLRVSLTLRGDGEVAYEYTTGGETCSSGVLVF